MAGRRETSRGFAPVEATEHADKRGNLPTTDAHDFVTPEVSAVGQQVWSRGPSLDPQLVWKGKDDRSGDLVVDVPPICIQEKVDPRVPVENLRRTAANPNPSPVQVSNDYGDEVVKVFPV